MIRWLAAIIGMVMTWPLSADEPTIQARALAAIGQANGGAEIPADKMAEIWESNPPTEAVAMTWALVEPTFAELMTRTESGMGIDPAKVPTFPNDPFLRSHAVMALGRRLTAVERYEEAAELFEQVDATELAEPASYYFHVALCAEQLGDSKRARDALASLLNLEDLPDRYAGLAEEIERQIASADPTSLAGIAHDMGDVRRRLSITRLDDRLLAVEEDVLRRLDELIEEAEDSEQKPSGQESQDRSTSAANDSKIGTTQGEGEVDRRVLVRDSGSWGNLPPEERERVVQEMTRELPGRYRDAIEEYFRQGARTETTEPAP